MTRDEWFARYERLWNERQNGEPLRKGRTDAQLAELALEEMGHAPRRGWDDERSPDGED